MSPDPNQLSSIGLTASNCLLCLIDFEEVHVRDDHDAVSRDPTDAVCGIVKAAHIFDVPILTTLAKIVTVEPVLHPVIAELLPSAVVHYRTSISAIRDAQVRQIIQSFNKNNLLLAGPMAELSLTLTTLDALALGFDVYVVADACSNSSTEGLGVSIGRLVQAGAVTVTWAQVAAEWQEDWSDQATGEAILSVFYEHGGPLARILGDRTTFRTK